MAKKKKRKSVPVKEDGIAGNGLTIKKIKEIKDSIPTIEPDYDGFFETHDKDIEIPVQEPPRSRPGSGAWC